METSCKGKEGKESYLRPFQTNQRIVILIRYRSVVFHPTKEVVLPGVLRHAYDFKGDLKPLFPESHCSFTVCSISLDKATILTDCPDDGKCIIMWSLENGSEITRINRDDYVLSFAWSRDGKLVAISHFSGRIDIVDAVDGFRTLGQTDLPNVCGMIKFSPNSRSLLCCRLSKVAGITNSAFRLSINIAEQLTCRVHVLEEPNIAWEFESRSEGGFLLGDPLSSRGVFEKVRGRIFSRMKFDFVLDKHTVLRSDDDRVEMLNVNEEQQKAKKAAHTNVEQIVFSLSGETIYVVSRHDDSGVVTATVTAWNVSSSELIAEKKVDVLSLSCSYLLAVKGGVLIMRREGTLQMWKFELSKCVRCWTNIGNVTQVIPISEERVACATTKNDVIILDTTSGEILSTIQIDDTTNLLACNSKFQILTWSKDLSLRLWDRQNKLWEKQLLLNKFGKFSPAETFVISYGNLRREAGICVLDAVSGKALHVLDSASSGLSPFFDCEFVSDEECVVISEAPSKQCLVELFNVKSGDLLSNLPQSNLPLSNLRPSDLWLSDLPKRVICLTASPSKRLVTIYPSDSKHGYELIQVRLPGDENRKSKR